MTTQVTLTGTGVPHPRPGEPARVGDLGLQFDAGRGTVLRLSDADVALQELAVVFVTHVRATTWWTWPVGSICSAET